MRFDLSDEEWALRRFHSTGKSRKLATPMPPRVDKKRGYRGQAVGKADTIFCVAECPRRPKADIRSRTCGVRPI